METQICEYSDLIVVPAQLYFEINEGSRFVPPSQDLFIKKVKSGLSASWDLSTASTWSAWLKLRPGHGRGPKRIRVAVKSIGMPAGEYSARITISTHATVTPSIVSVTLRVKGEVPPEKPPKETPKEPPKEPPKGPPEQPPEQPPEEPAENNWQDILLKLLKRLWDFFMAGWTRLIKK